MDDFGPVGEGASMAHYVRAENGSEYLAKSPSFNPGLPYVAANEFIAVGLASIVVLPVLDYKIIENGADLWFGSSWIEKNKSFYPALSKELFARAGNKSRCYDIATFDYWIYNTDRHVHNLLLRKQATGGGVVAELLVLNDHSHALIQAGTSPADMTNYVGEIPALHLDFLREAVTSASSLSASVELIQGIPDEKIRSVCRSTPQEWLKDKETVLVEQFLCTRRDNLRKLINDSIVVLPALKGKKI
jgi:hypothetical protein